MALILPFYWPLSPVHLSEPGVLRPHVERVVAGAGGERGVGQRAALHPHIAVTVI